MVRKLLLIVLFLGVLIGHAFAQNRVGTREINKVADTYFDASQFFKAASYYLQSLDVNPNDGHANYHLGECYRNLFDYSAAEVYYKKVSETALKPYPLSLYYYGLMQKLNGKFDQAMLTFDQFSEYAQTNTSRTLDNYPHIKEQAKIDREGCLLALNQLSHPYDDYGFKHLSAPLNSEYNDFAPSTIISDKELAISSGRGGKGSGVNQRLGEAFTDVFRFREANGVWTEVKAKDNFAVINSKFGDGSGTFNTERSKYYYTNCHEDLGSSCHIFVSKFSSGKWQEPITLNSNINLTNYSSKHPTLSNGGDTIFFSSTRPGGSGMSDIWMSIAAGEDNWGPAINMGSQINTPLQEVSPFFAHNEQALFFASDGHRGFGGFDLFMAKGREFNDPEIFNMGYPFNSNKDELYVFMGKNTGYLCSNRKGGLGKFDIYSFIIETEEEVIAQINREESVAGRNSLFSDDYEFDNQSREQVEKIISLILASQLYSVDLAFTDAELEFYQSLSTEDKARIERIVKSRIRNLSDSDLTAMRDEDELFYGNLSDQGKEHVDGIINSYLEERGLSPSISLEQGDKEFYENLNLQDKERLERVIAQRLQSVDNTDYFGESADDRQFYSNLTSEERDRVDRLAVAYVTAKADFLDIEKATADKNYLGGLSAVKEFKTNAAVKNQLRKLFAFDQFKLKPEDQAFYEQLPSEAKNVVDRISTAFLVSDLNTLSENLQQTDLDFYQALSPAERVRFDKLIAAKIKNLSDGDQYYYQNLNLNDQERIDALAQAYVAAGNDINNLLSQLPEDAAAYYNSLSEAERTRIDRIIVGRSKNLGSPYYQYYHELTESDYYRSWRLAISAYLSTHDASQSSPAAKSFYQSQSPQDQSKIESILASPLKNVSSGALAYYANLSGGQKNTVAKLLGTFISNDGNLPLNDLTSEQGEFYQGLNASEKAKVDEIMASTFKNLSSEERSYIRNLGSQEKGYVGLLAQSYFLKHAGILASKLGGEELSFYQGLNDQDQKLVDDFNTEQMSDLNSGQEEFLDNLGSEEKNAAASLMGVAVLSDGELVPDNMSKADREFYDQLDDQGKALMGEITSAKFSNLSQQQASFIEGLSEEEKASLGKLTKAHVQSALAEVPGDEQFDSPEIAKIQQIISLMVSAELYGVKLAFTDEQLQFYNSLTSADKEKIQRQVRSRVRILSGSGLTAMREEDELFYNNLPSESKDQMDGMIFTVLEDQDLVETLALSTDQVAFYENLTPEDKEKTDRLIAYNLAQGQTAQRGGNSIGAEFYGSLPQADKDRIDRLAKDYLSNGQDFGEIISGGDEDYYQSLSEQDQMFVKEAVKERLLNLNQNSAFSVTETTQGFYQTLSETDKNAIDQLATTLVTADPDNLTGELDQGAKDLLNRVESTQRDELNKVVATRVSNLLKADQYFYGHLGQEDQDRIDQLAKVMDRSQPIEAYMQNLTGDDQAFYDGLDKDEQKRLERLLALKSAKGAAPSADMADIKIDKEIDPTTQKSALATEEIIRGDIEYYNGLSDQQQQQIDRIVGISLAARQYQDDPNLQKSDQQYYSSLERGEKETIDRLSRVFSGDPKAYLTNADQSYYEFMAPEKRQRINRLIVLQGMNKSQKGRVEMEADDQRYLRNLDNDQAARLFRLMEIRQANSRIMGKNLEVDYQALSLTDVIAKINTYNTQDFEFVTVSGKLINLISGLPAAEIEVPLVDDKDEVIKLTTTDKDGSFRYSNLPADENFRIITGQNKSAGDSDQYFIKDLNVKGSKKIAGKIKYENIYFSFNSDTLSGTSVKVLEELVDLSQTHPGMQIEMNAYTDRIGSDDYNIALSERRGKSAFNFLVQNGMPRTSLVINAKGKATPRGANNVYQRQLSRRVEFEIFGVESYNSRYVTYIVKPQTTLFSIAKAFDMSVDEVVKLNGLTSNVIEAYSPIRVKRTDKEIDSKLVYEESASFKGVQKYIVQDGETVISLAQKFNIPEELLMELNGLRSFELTKGQELDIYVQ